MILATAILAAAVLLTLAAYLVRRARRPDYLDDCLDEDPYWLSGAGGGDGFHNGKGF